MNYLKRLQKTKNMESIYYNAEDKQVGIVLGYGIGNHLSLKFLGDVVKSIRELFTGLTDEQAENLRFLECSDVSRNHKYCWYTVFDYDLYGEEVDEYGRTLFGNRKIHTIHSRLKGADDWQWKDESAREIMYRLINGL